MPAVVAMDGPARASQRLHCGECNGTALIHGDFDVPVLQCPRCGWGDLEMSQLVRAGACQPIIGSVHGLVTVQTLT